MSNQEDESRFHPEVKRMITGLFAIAIIIALIIACFTIAPKLEKRVNDAIADIETEQIAEGERYTTVVTSIDASKGLLFMDNGDKIPIEDLSAQPAVDDKLTYIKTFDYKTSRWDGMPKRLDSETIINIEIIGNTLTE